MSGLAEVVFLHSITPVDPIMVETSIDCSSIEALRAAVTRLDTMVQMMLRGLDRAGNDLPAGVYLVKSMTSLLDAPVKT